MILETITVPRLSTLLVPFAFWAGTTVEESAEEFCLDDIEQKKIVFIDTVPKYDSTLIHALINVESRGKSNCVGDTHLGEPSIGVKQIRPKMDREENTILKI